MSLPSPMSAPLVSRGPALVASSPSLWRFPTALNTTFVSDFIARLPPDGINPSTGNHLVDWGNGTTSPYPPSIFGSRGTRPDIILDAIYGLSFEQRVGTPRMVMPNNDFGREDVTVRFGDTITLDWDGGEEKVVTMTCHECNRWVSQSQGLFEGCERFDNSYGELMQFHQVTLSKDGKHMSSQLEDDYLYVNWTATQPKIAPGTPIVFPELSGLASGSVCIFTLDWDPWRVNTKHSVPFPVDGKKRQVGQNELGAPVYDAWAFNSTFPKGVSILGRREEPNVDNGDGGSTNNNGDGRSDKKEVPMGTIVAAVVGGIAGFIIVMVILHKLMRRSERHVAGEDAVETASGHNNGPRISPQSEIISVDVIPPPTYEEATKK